MIQKENVYVDNTPNAARLIESLKSTGYDDVSALADIVDNSIDAGAIEIKVEIERKRNSESIDTILIVDNGCGMTEEVLDQALRLGSDTTHESTDMGKFGMGLSTAGISMANITSVFTRSNESDIVWKASTDINKIIETNQFIKELGEASLEETTWFNNYIKSTGTIIKFEDCCGIKAKNVKNFVGNIKNEFGRIYRKFLDKITIYINDIKIDSEDFLMENEISFNGDNYGSSEIYTNTQIPIEIDGNEYNIDCKLVLLPKMPQAATSELKVNYDREGFSILRNGRELQFGWWPRTATRNKHNKLNRVRGEINFDPALDKLMGVNFRKAAISPNDSVLDKISNILNSNLKGMAIAIDSQKGTKEVDNEHQASTAIINKRSKRLITPKKNNSTSEAKTLKETRNGSKHINKTKNTPTDPKTERGVGSKPREVDSLVKWKQTPFIGSPYIYETYKEGNTTVIDLNTNHPFYRFYINNDDRTSLDFLLYSLATAEVKLEDNFPDDIEDIRRVMENFKMVLGSNTKNLLD